MVEASKKMVEVTNEFKEVMCNMMKSEGMDVLKNMSTDEFKMLQLCLKAVDISNEVIMEQAKTLDELNRKLDLLLDNKTKNV